MGRIYAGILGSLAFVTLLARNIVGGGRADSAVVAALVALVVFAVTGYVVGQLAGWIVEESVTARFVGKYKAEAEDQPANQDQDAARPAA